MKILVTGALGFIGSHTCVELLAKGYTLVGIDNLSNSDLSVKNRIETIAKKNFKLYVIDLCDKEKLKSVFVEHPDLNGIIHFAAFKAVGESVANPLKYYQNNLVSLINLLDLCLEFNHPNFVFSSSCTVYGQPDKLPVAEDATIQAAWSPYGNTKQVGEEIIKDSVLAYTNKIRAISLRYFNPIGAHPSALIGEIPLGVPQNLMPYITQTALGLRKELLVYGSDYPTPDGTAVRDYLHVVDLAIAHIQAIDRLYNKTSAENYEYFNLGAGIGYSVLDVIKSFEKTTNQKLNYKIVDRRPGDVEKIYADPQKANDILKWKVERSLDEMTESAWQWEKYYREHVINKK